MPDDPRKVYVLPAGEVCVIRITGHLKLGHPALDELRDRLAQLVEARQVQWLFDLKDVPSMDSTGIGVLARAYTSATTRGGKLKLVHLAEVPAKMLKIVNLLPLFEVFDDPEEAIASFKK